jgi:murein DD-endopeptidase MepM/ murein hydrolase activator NlpD
MIAGAVAATGCTEYRSLRWEDTGTWAEARARAYDDEKRGNRAAAAPASLAAAGDRHLVLPGETLSELAVRYHVPMQQLIRLNGIKPPHLLYVGQVLTIPPGVVPPASATAVAQAGAPRAPSRLPIPRPGDPPLQVAVHATGAEDPAPAAGPSAGPPLPDPALAAATRRAAEAKPPSLSGDGFLWPVRGDVLSRFGEKPNGARNDGINIAARAGTPVRAAENGIVVYAGDAITGFGRMLLIRHADGFTTAYAHNSDLLVSVGDEVRRGQVIARVGATGAVRHPQLHFELRSGRQALDPAKHLVRAGTEVASAG